MAGSSVPAAELAWIELALFNVTPLNLVGFKPVHLMLAVLVPDAVPFAAVISLPD